jgi:creatinine amidohydrolase
VIPFTPNNASADLPGTIGLTPELLSALLDRMAREAIKTGFKNVVFMQDHGGGSNAYREVATKLDAEFSPQGIHVWYCDDVYVKAGADFDKWLTDNGYPSSSHAGIPDTSVMLYLGGDLGWVRVELSKTAVGDPVRARGAPRDSTTPRVNNGITGDARRSSKELGKRLFDIKVDYAVKQITGFMTAK